MSERDTQFEAQYRGGSPVSNCGICMHYQGHHRCNQVMGDISPYGVCQHINVEDNPFGSTMSPQQKQAINQLATTHPSRRQPPMMATDNA